MEKKLIILYLRDKNPEVVIELLEDDINKIINKIKIVYENILSAKFTPIKGIHCDWCDYRDLICSEYG